MASTYSPQHATPVAFPHADVVRTTTAIAVTRKRTARERGVIASPVKRRIALRPVGGILYPVNLPC